MATMVLLRLVHILSGIFWAGSAIFTAFFLMPALRDAGTGAGPIMAGLERRRLMTWLPVSALLTMMSGLAMIWIISNGQIGLYARSGPGRIFTMAGGLAILAFMIALVTVRPTMVKAGKLAMQLPSLTDDATRSRLNSELVVLRRRGAMMSAAVTALLLVAAAGMAVARYL
jgi:uncharacterized membrane protein